MTSAEHPITRSELREELGQHRSEIRKELGHYATKSELREELSHYATKEDLANLETRLTREISDFKGEIKDDFTTLIKWMVGVQIGGIAAIATIATAIIAITKILGG